MINVSGHLRNRRRIVGFADNSNPLTVNCCGMQVFKTKDYSQRRSGGRVDYQIIYIYEGTGHYFLNNEWVSLPAGNILLFRPSEPQIYSYYANEKPVIYWIHFTGAECDALLEKYCISSCYIGENLSLKILFQDIITELQLKKVLYEDLVIHSFYKILAIICRSRQQILMPSENNFSIDRLIIQLNQKYMDKWTISSMADFCKLSEGHFAHMFKSRIGVSPMHFLNELRVEKAKSLIAADTMSISTIASLVGFDDPLYFSRVFKRVTGIAPQNFHRNALESNTPEWWPAD